MTEENANKNAKKKFDGSQDEILSLFDREAQREQVSNEWKEIIWKGSKEFINILRSEYRSWIRNKFDKLMKEKEVYGKRFEDEEKIRRLKEINQNELITEYFEKIIEMEGKRRKEEGLCEVEENFKKEWKNIVGNIVKKELELRFKWYGKHESWKEHNRPERVDARNLDYIRKDADKILTAIGSRRVRKIDMMTFPKYKEVVIDVILELNRFSYGILLKYGGTDDILLQKVKRNKIERKLLGDEM